MQQHFWEGENAFLQVLFAWGSLKTLNSHLP